MADLQKVADDRYLLDHGVISTQALPGSIESARRLLSEGIEEHNLALLQNAGDLLTKIVNGEPVNTGTWTRYVDGP